MVGTMKPAAPSTETRSPPRAGEVQLWMTSLDPDAAEIETSRLVLSEDETRRADTFRRPVDRTRFTAARGWLRRRLAAYLGRDPARLVFSEGPHGKPFLPEAEGVFDFNLSHSGGFALLAVSPGFPVGADIEEMRPIEEKVAERFFSADEVRALLALPLAEREAAFFRCWTRKEAYLKALGSGLAKPLDGFTVSLGSDEPACLLRVAGAPGEAEAWRMAHLAPVAGYMAAVAARDLGWHPVWPDGLPLDRRKSSL